MFTTCHFVCGPTDDEGRAFHRSYMEENVHWESVEQLMDNYIPELKCSNAEVLPRLEARGLRRR